MTKFTIRPQFASACHTGYLTLIIDTPTLRGSDKQIAWATYVIDQAKRQIAEELIKVAGIVWGIVRPSDVEHIEMINKQIDEFLAQERFAATFERIAKVFMIDRARFWIDNRDRDMESMVSAAERYLEGRDH